MNAFRSRRPRTGRTFTVLIVVTLSPRGGREADELCVEAAWETSHMAETTRAPVDVFEKARVHDRKEQLEAAKEADLLPYFRLIESEAGPVVEMEGHETIMLG